MGRLLPATFRFSPLITAVSLLLAAAMLTASAWQWQRYQYKRQLVATYQSHATTLPLPFPLDAQTLEQFQDVLHRKVELEGDYDFAHQMIVLNRRHRSGPGYWLLTPLKPKGSEQWVIVSRGFIPFGEDNPKDWRKYSFTGSERLEAVVQEAVPHRTFLAPGSEAGTKRGFERKWLYPDLEKIAAQLPYPANTAVYVQRLGSPPEGTFPAEAVSIRVPPSTHFGYTIEWALLAAAALTIGFLLQAFPRRRGGGALRGPAGLKRAALLLMLLAGGGLPERAQATDRADLVPDQAKITERLGEKLDLSLTFTDSNGEPIQLKDLMLPGRPLIVAPVYYECPQLCNLTQSGLADAINKLKLQLGSDYTVASISFNPNETSQFAAEKAATYRELLRCQPPGGHEAGGCDPGAWRFLTGAAPAIKKLTEQIGFSYVPDGKDYIHAAVLMVITAEGVISRYLYGVRYPQNNVRLALVEASAGRIGSTFDRALLYCFRYDHLQGQYTLSILRVVRVFCISVFFILTACLVGLRVKEKRRSSGRAGG